MGADEYLNSQGEGTNFSAIINNSIKVDKVITNNPKAGVIKRAIKYNVPVIVLSKKTLDQKKGLGYYERRLNEEIPKDTDLIVLAGYMLILSKWFCEKWKNKIINIHPSILPAFAGGCHAIKDAYDYGCKVFGVTIHWVTPEVDAGPIIDQRAVRKLDNDTLEEITTRIRGLEHHLYPQVIKSLLIN